MSRKPILHPVCVSVRSLVSVKNASCKHIHAVALYERRSESISALLNTEEEKNSLTV
jgi:hypothetical protein